MIDSADRIFYRAIAFHIAIALIAFLTMFLSCKIFVEEEIISKWYAFIGGSMLCIFIAMVTTKTPVIRFDGISVLLCVFIGYLLLRNFQSGLMPNMTVILSFAAFMALYFSLKIIPDIQFLNVLLLCACTAQAAYGLIQYVGLINTSSVHSVPGSFDNPAGLAGCLAAGFPLSLSVIWKGGWQRYLGISSVFCVSLSVICSGSRAAIISILLVISLYLTIKYRDIIRRYRNYTIVSIIVLLMTMAGLFFLKKDSAYGRILIWKNSMEMILDKPLIGHSPGAFMSKYMEYQSDYFAGNPNSSYSQLADNVTHPFNEYLLLMIEYGMIGFVLLLSGTLLIIKSGNKLSISHLCLISIAIFACFSYPLRYPFVWVVIAYSLASIKTKWSRTLFINKGFKTIALLGLLVFTIYFFQDMQFEKQWGKLTRQYRFQTNKDFLCNYKTLYEDWNGDPMFLYNYGTALKDAKAYEASNKTLFQCIEYLNDYDVQMVIADNYFNMARWEQARTAYESAQHMLPNRFMPLYKLMLLNEAIHNTKQALEIAEAIRDKKIKIPSKTVNFIKQEAVERLKTFKDIQKPDYP